MKMTVTWIKMVAVEVDNWLDLRYMLKAESIGLGGGTNRDMRKEGYQKFGLKKYKSLSLYGLYKILHIHYLI